MASLVCLSPDYNLRIMRVSIVIHSSSLSIHLSFADGVNQFRVSRATGQPLPNPRVISNRLSFALGHGIQNRKLPDDLANVNFVFFAQFLDHDLGNTFPKPITTTTPVFGAFPQLNCCGGPNGNYSETYITPTRQTRRWCISMK